jgi:fumarate reductase subunit C
MLTEVGNNMYIKNIAKEWYKYSEDYRKNAMLRAYSARACIWGLVFLAVTFFPPLFKNTI